MATLSRIAPEIPVADLQAAIGFYQQKLGFQVAAVMPDGDYAIVERDGVAIHLFLDELGSYMPAGLHIFTEEIEDLHDELKGRGANVTQGIKLQPWGNRDFRVRDDFGNELKFTEPA